MELNLVLVEPQIPQNTGNIARTCAATGARLHLVKPLGFEIDDKKLKRAGLDYWHLLDISYYDGLEDFFSKNQGDSGAQRPGGFTAKPPIPTAHIWFLAGRTRDLRRSCFWLTRIPACGCR